MIPKVPVGCRIVPDFPFYCLSSRGEVYSCRTRGGVIVPWRLITPFLCKPLPRGRLCIGFRNGRPAPHPKYVHRLVLQLFVGDCQPGLEACHNDGNPLNCDVSNLRWDTHLSNMADRRRHGQNPSGTNNPSAKLNESQVRQIRALYKSGVDQKVIAPRFGVSKQCIHLVCTGKTWADVA